MKNSILSLFVILFGLTFFHSQTKDPRYQPKEYVQIKHPEWSKNATIYEVNLRQYTNEGTFKSFESHLQRLKKMGVDIIWLMPIHPIGEKNRKGGLGSYYSVKDFRGINPEFGTMQDFKNLVNKIHSMGMYVIIDWVGNHSAWDNPLATTHPHWYTKTRSGNFQPTPWYDWDDVIDFDYDNPDFRKYMTESLKFWVKEANIDGYRADVAGFIPVDFWENARAELDQIKPVFMLAEWESRDLYKKSFDMTYSWTLFDKLKDATTQNKGIAGLVEYLSHDVNSVPKNAYRMVFTDNHDMNSWNGTPQKNFGDGLKTSIVFTGVVNGMQLCYSGQEAGLNRSLKFFDKDPIEWKDHENEVLFSKLFHLKHENQALWNGKYGGEMIRVVNDHQDRVVSFYREKNQDAVLPIFNFSDKTVEVNLDTQYFQGKYRELFTDKNFDIKEKTMLNLEPWSYLVLVKGK
ncbi:alpha-glucosidase C-terminal domain-containing protein [Candidatus Kaistella beijingensis]|uniref:alpha-amylase family glycosyl hydrolase n=1 Tax=Candidatus Kaistella beijingensis TaxID=2820270 RepID=UPI001CC576A3|nr:alpha-amylase family glycosyl hydrolase [Candidatus Kaistella beijingensis]UBB89317.1 alpha-glucosidase C-terminal domain-containing protein [Candidatus Kaistella beijingensis]